MDEFFVKNLDKPIIFLSEQNIYKSDIEELKEINDVIGILHQMINTSNDMDEIESYNQQLEVANKNYSDAVVKTGRFWTKSGAFSRSIHQVKGDGNCMFRSIAVCMGRSEEEHLNYRRDIVTYGTLNFHKLDQELMKSEGYPNGERYRDAMIDPIVWGGNIELIIASIVYDCCIVVMNDNGYELTTHIFHQGEQKPSNYVYDGYTIYMIRNNNHYNALI